MAKDPNHPFLKDRGAKQLYIVCRIDDYSEHVNDRGGFSPGSGQYLNKGGYLWMTAAQAEAAAKHVLISHTGAKYGVFQLVAIVEEANAPVKVTRVA